MKRRDRTGTVYASVCVFCTPLKINSVNACHFKRDTAMFTKKQKRANRTLCISVICPVTVCKNLSVQLILLIHIPEGRQATNMSTKNKFKSIQDSSLKTLKSEHVIVRQRKESLWIVEWKNGRCSFVLFPVYCYNPMWQISQCCFDEMGWRKHTQKITKYQPQNSDPGGRMV
jgi:hypothetical protein